jgi:hypothetical protein
MLIQKEDRPMKLLEVLKAFWCKHKEVVNSSCPFTEKTYEVCTDCGLTVSVTRNH